jgi:leucyl aminopeptidase
MRFDLWSKAFPQTAADCLVVGVFEEGDAGEHAHQVDAAVEGRLKKILARGDFAGRPGETLLVPDLPGIAASRVLLVGLGARKSFSRKAFRRACAAAFAALTRTSVRSAAIGIDRPPAKELDDYYFCKSIAELGLNALYRVNDLKTGKKAKTPALDAVSAGPVKPSAAKNASRGFEHGEAAALGMRVQRDLANLPANVCTPTYIADQAKALAKQYESVQVKVLDEAAIRREKMGCFLAVTQGSHEPPRFIVLEHRPGRAKGAPVVLVGKGITFDTGGISLKDPPSMDEMKFDMTGAAAVIGAITFVAEIGLPLRVVGLIASCENMPSSRAVKPGDIVTSAAGHTVEILNTDAEGRLILADALHYARRFEPAAVVNIATLTGACVVALGAHHSGLFGNDEALVRELLAAGQRGDDRAWHMPLTEEYGDQLKSNFADFANVGGREGGAITAATFLSKFTQGLAWAHLDIAGTAYVGGAQKGSTGRPMNLLADFLIHRAKG